MKHLIIGTAGHVDHGKTALIKALTDIDCDTHKQEKERGITINLGFAHMDLPGGESVGIIDVPGHKDFIRTMVAGAFGIDIVMLVIAADSGIMPQTKEHLNIIGTLGVKKGIVVITKTDLVDEEMLELARLEVTEFLEGTVFEDVPMICVSSVNGAGIAELKEEVGRMVKQVEQREASDFFRMYVDRLFSVKGLGFVVTGTVLNGRVNTGDELFLLPGKNKKMKVKGIQRHGKTVDQAYAGDRAALNLSGLKSEDFKRGMLLSDKELKETGMVDASVTIFNHDHRIKTWSMVIFYAGTFECMARMHLLDREKLDPGETGLVQLHLEQPGILMNKDKFIIRNTSGDLTFGGGVIIDVNPLHHKKRTEKLLTSLEVLARATLQSGQLADLMHIELFKERKPLYPSDLAAKLNKGTEEIMQGLEGRKDTSVRTYHVGEQLVLIAGQVDDEHREKALREIREWHEKYPILETGLDTRELIGKLGFSSLPAGKTYVEGLINALKDEGLIRPEQGTWVMTGHEVKMDTRTIGQLEWLEGKLKAFGMEKPQMKDLEAMALDQGIRKERLKMLLTFLGKQGKVCFHEDDFIYAPIADRCRITLLRDLAGKPAGINEKELRDLLGATKKISQLLISMFINEGIIQKRTFYVLITEKGKNFINNA